MKRFLSVIFRFSIVVLLLCAVGCGKIPHAGEYMIFDEHPALVIPEDKGVVCFIRKSGFIGGGATYLILENEIEIGAVESGTFFFHEATEGKHTFYADIGTEGYITVDVKKGMANYIVTEVAGGLAGTRPVFYEVPEEIARRLLKEHDYEYIRRRTPEEYEAWKAKHKKKTEF